jgi:hypothetical protein
MAEAEAISTVSNRYTGSETTSKVNAYSKLFKALTHLSSVKYCYTIDA